MQEFLGHEPKRHNETAIHIYNSQIKIYRHASDAVCNRKDITETEGDDIFKNNEETSHLEAVQFILLFLQDYK